MTIVDVEKIYNADNDGKPQLKMTFRYDNKEKNKVMKSVNFNRIDDKGYAEAGEWDGNTLNLNVSDPVYYLTEEYILKFNR